MKFYEYTDWRVSWTRPAKVPFLWAVFLLSSLNTEMVQGDEILFSWETMTCLSYIIDTIVTDALAAGAGT